MNKLKLAFSLLSFLLILSCNDELPPPLNSELEADFTISTSSISSQIDITVNDVSRGNVTRRKWLFKDADQSVSTQPTPNVRFLKEGMTQITLYVYDDDQNLSDTITRRFNVFPGSGLVAHFPFDSLANDYSGNAYHGIISGTEVDQDVNGNLRSARIFKDESDYISVSSKVDNHLEAGATFSAWIKPLDTMDIGTIISNRVYSWVGSPPPNFNAGFSFTYGTYDYRGIGLSYARSLDGNIWCRSNDSNKITLNEWSHVIVTWNGETNFEKAEFEIYLNGQKSDIGGGTHDANKDYSFVETEEPLIIGGNDNNNFHGLIDEIRIYDRALSAEQIQLLYSYKE